MQSSPSLDQPLVIPDQIRHRARRRRWLFVAVGLSLVAGVAIALFRPFKTANVEFRSALIERRTILRTVDATGHLDVERRVEIAAPAPGRVAEIFVRAGDPVTRGQNLARLDQQATSIAAEGARASLRVAASRVSEAIAVLAGAADTRQRTERLLERELASTSELKAAQGAEARAQATLAGARAESSAAELNLKSAELARSLATIVAPLDGIVLKALDAVGAAVAPEKGPLFVIGSSLDPLRVYADIGESDIGEVRVGQTAHFTVPAFPTRSFLATIKRVGVDSPRTGIAVQYPIELRAENTDRSLFAGMTATVHIDVARAEDVLATREAALRFRPEGASDAPPRSRLFVIEGDRLLAVQVETGLSDGAFTELRPASKDALAVGMRVALGVLGSDAQARGGPGIKLGKR